MPAIDSCHEQIKTALQKDGWQIRSEQYRLLVGQRTVYVDMEAVKGQNGSRRNILLVEVKCFTGREAYTTDLYIAIGQCLVYQSAASVANLPHDVILAVPQFAYEAIFDDVIMNIVKQTTLTLLVVNLQREEITQWIP